MSTNRRYKKGASMITALAPFSIFLFFGMALGASGRGLFGFILFIEFFVASLAVCVQRLGVILGNFFFFGKLLFSLFALGSFTWYFVAFDAFLDIVAVF